MSRKLQADLALPGALGQSQGLDQVLPSLSSSLLLSQVLQELLTLVHQHSQVPLVDLILLATLERHMVRQHLDLRRQDSNLHFRGASIWSSTWSLLNDRRRVSRCPWLKDDICVVATKGLNAPLNVRPRSILLVSLL